MIPEFWTTRSEAYLAAINGETVELPEPQSRMELYLAKIAGADVEVPDPQTRSELFLAAILGESVELPAPRSRVEFYLAKIAGMDVEIPVPLTRIDAYLAEWAENGSGWSWETVTGVSPLALASAAAHAVKSLVQHGKCTTSGGDIYCNNGKLVAVDDELPTGYKRVLGFSMNNNAYWKITDFPLYGSDTLRFSFEATDACNIIGAYSGSASGNNYSLYAAASSNYLRYKSGAYNSAIDFNTRYDVEITPTGSHGMKTDSTWTAQEFTTPTDLCIGTTSTSASSAKLKGKMYGNVEVVGRAKFIPCERVSDNVLGYYDVIREAFHTQASGYAGAASLGYDHSHETVLAVVGTPEVLTIGTQAAHVENLFEVGGVADEQDIISGVITRKVGVTVANGVITLSALATPVIEHTTPQPLSTVEGTNTVSWTAEVSGTVKEVEYAYEAPSFEWKTASGAVVSVNDAIAGEVGALTVSINPVQTGSGDPSPSNVRPISGWSNIDVWVQPTYDTSANPSATIPLGGTYYGGTLDVATGVLTVDKVKFNFTGTESWGYLSSADGFFYCSLLTAGTFVSGDYITENGVKMYLNANNGQARVYLSNNTFLTSSTDMHDYCKSGIGFVYSLSTPQTVQLTPAQVSTLLGTNVIWASGNGEISVTYRAEASE